jgi:hypothetical protein
MAEPKLTDSGKRVSYNSGAVREPPVGKGRYDLISPIFLKELAMHCERGAVKYGNGRNWEAGIDLSRYLDAALRHINQYREGDRSEPHDVAAAWNLMAFIHTKEMIKRGLLQKELDNVPTYTKQEE